MKRILLTITALLTFAPVAMQAQDTVRESDPWYMTTTLGTYDHVDCDTVGYLAGYPIYFKNYGKEDTIDVYGVAMTVNGLMTAAEVEEIVRVTGDSSALWMMPSVGLVKQLTPGIVAHPPVPPEVSFVDSANIFGPLKKCFFEYTPREENGEIKCHLYPHCVEFYFSQPHRFYPSDTFYTCFWYLPERYSRYYDWSWDGSDLLSLFKMNLFVMQGYDVSEAIVWESLSPEMSRIDGGNWNFIPNYRRFRGLVFPIVKLRCTKPRLELVGHDSTSVSVRWTTPEAGEVYQVSLGPYGFDPDSGMLVTAVDTHYTFTGLSPDAAYAIQVRKGCRYTTDGYDTLVWSDWSNVVGLTMPHAGVQEAADGHVAVAVQDGCVAVSGLAPAEWAEVYDMLGCRVALLQADGRTEPLPQGVYMVRVAQGSARKVVVLRR